MFLHCTDLVDGFKPISEKYAQAKLDHLPRVQQKYKKCLKHLACCSGMIALIIRDELGINMTTT